MQNALWDCKRLLRYGVNYGGAMPTPAARLKRARIAAGFEHAKDAAQSMGIAVSTYLGHENGSRGIPASRASLYARRFRISEQWLLYGKGQGPNGENDTSGEIARIIESLSTPKRQAALAMLKGLAATE
jgi:hypothetical protein